MSGKNKRIGRGQRADLAAATEQARNEMFMELHSDHIECIAAAKKYGFDSLAARAWGCAWKAATAATCAPLCESPLEIKLLGALLNLASPPPNYLSPMPEVTLECQKQIGPYRVDFLIETDSYEGDRIRIVIEVDGHEFHERTKDQAQRDKERDRFFAVSGYLVMRFTGREVFRDAGGCSAEVSAYIERMHCHPEDRDGQN